MHCKTFLAYNFNRVRTIRVVLLIDHRFNANVFLVPKLCKVTRKDVSLHLLIQHNNEFFKINMQMMSNLFFARLRYHSIASCYSLECPTKNYVCSSSIGISASAILNASGSEHEDGLNWNLMQFQKQENRLKR